LEGLLTALGNLDAIIDILRHAPDGTTAKQRFQQQFNLSERQSDAILAMPLRKLTGMERQGLEEEFREFTQRRDELQRLLSDRKELLKAMKKELRGLRKKFGDPRRTRIQTEAERAEEFQQVEEIIAETGEEAVVIEFTQKGYVRRYGQRAYQRRQARLEVDANPQLHEVEDDPTSQVEAALTSQEILTLTRDGRAFTLTVDEVPANSRQGKGVPLVNLLPDSVPPEAEAIVAQMVLREDYLDRDLILVSQKGKIKRIPLQEFTHLTGRGLTAMKVKEGDELAYVAIAQEGDDMVLGTSGGRLLRFPIDDDNLPIMGRAALGPQGIRLGKQETLVGCVAVESGYDCVLMLSAAGYGKRLPVETLRVTRRGDIGTQSFQFSLKTDRLVAVIPATSHSSITVLTSADRAATLPIDSIPRQGRTGECDRLVKPKQGETITQVIRLCPLDNGEAVKPSTEEE
ncbi:MAG TPA: DNA topoisomerase IV, partial [Leptolyngbyaceae cyanobacterium M65_K2018_010]|nr:DNA topoisomerase IV [Leptolyngbyaceae cyanobacterium M65_K2018_010]